MFNDTFEGARKSLAMIQKDFEPIAVKMNAVNPSVGGPGLSAEDAHRALSFLIASVHNLAMVMGNVIDELEEHLDSQRNSHQGDPSKLDE